MSRIGYGTSIRPGPRSLLFLLAACSPGTELYIERLWPEETPAILIVTGEAGEILAPTPVLLTTPVQRLAFSAPDRLIVHVQTFAALRGRDLATCGLTTGEGEDLGGPLEAWTSGLIAADDPIELELDEVPKDFNLRVTGCVTLPKSCDAVATHVDAPDRFQGLQGVAAISDSAMFAAGNIRSQTDLRTDFLRIEDDTVIPVDPIDVITGLSYDVETDGESILGSADNRIFTLDLAGRLLSTSTVAFLVTDLDTGKDGTTIFVGRAGQLVALSRGSTVARALEPPPYPNTTVDVPRIAVANAERFMVYGPDGNIWVYEGTWREELSELDEEIDGIAIDERYLLVNPTDGSTLLHDATTSEWMPIGTAILSGNVKAVDAFGDGRFLLVGQGGRVAYYNGERLCNLLTGTEQRLEDVDFSPSGSSAWIVGEVIADAYSRPTILRFDFR